MLTQPHSSGAADVMLRSLEPSNGRERDEWSIPSSMTDLEVLYFLKKIDRRLDSEPDAHYF